MRLYENEFTTTTLSDAYVGITCVRVEWCVIKEILLA